LTNLYFAEFASITRILDALSISRTSWWQYLHSRGNKGGLGGLGTGFWCDKEHDCSNKKEEEEKEGRSF